jgi:hypothetical protein
MTMKTLSIAAAAALLLAAGAANAQNKPSGVSVDPTNAWQLPAAGSGGASAGKQDAKQYNQGNTQSMTPASTTTTQQKPN